jgi:membrane fusion protein
LVPGLQVQGSVFRAVVQLDAQSISAYGREFQIQPGQRFSAVIVLDRRSLIQWLFDPIFAVLSYQ